MSITINQSVTSLLKRRAQLSLPALKKIAICKEKIVKLEEEIAGYMNMLNVDNQWAMEIFGKNITDLIIVKKIDNRTKLEYNPEYFDIESKAITDKLGRIITKEVITWRFDKSESDTPINTEKKEVPNDINQENELETVSESQIINDTESDNKNINNTSHDIEVKLQNEQLQKEIAFPVEDVDDFSQFSEEL